jgi:hypothetical protein
VLKFRELDLDLTDQKVRVVFVVGVDHRGPRGVKILQPLCCQSCRGSNRRHHTGCDRSEDFARTTTWLGRKGAAARSLGPGALDLVLNWVDELRERVK